MRGRGKGEGGGGRSPRVCLPHILGFFLKIEKCFCLTLCICIQHTHDNTHTP